MFKYLLKRMLLMIPTLIGMTIVVFVIIRVAPGDPIELQTRGEGGETAQDATQGDRNMDLMREQMGLTGNYFQQYMRYVSKVTRGDLGESLVHTRPVAEMIRERVGVTILLNIIVSLLVYVISVPIGLIAAKYRERGGIGRFVFDTSTGVILMVLYSVPVIFLGTLLVVLLAGGGQLSQYVASIRVDDPQRAALLEHFVFPIGGLQSEGSQDYSLLGYLGDIAHHLVLPVIALTLGGLAFMSKQARTSLLENLRQDYVRTARAKGLRERTVVYVHALRNSLLPLLTLMTGILPGLIGGSIIIEQIFNLPGMGLLFWQAVQSRDYTVIQGVSLVGAVLSLAAILMTDVLYAVVDPRIRYE